MNNNFSQKDRELFFWNYTCWNCGQNHPNCLHHIMGRGHKSDDCESSPLNAAPVNNSNCHININLNGKRSEFLKKTYQFLIVHGYKLTEKDKRFMQKYKEYYE